MSPRPEGWGGSVGDMGDEVYHRLRDNISALAPVVRRRHRAVSSSRLTISLQKPTPGTLVPQRPYRQGAVIQGGATGQIIMFATADGSPFPAHLALAGRCDLLVDKSGAVFPDQNQTINMRIEVSGCFVIPRYIAHPISTLTVARVRWMGRTGENRVF